jgi:hypothetical protein
MLESVGTTGFMLTDLRNQATVRTEAMELESTITCPECGHAETETMPTDACQFYYDCNGCGALLRPKKGHCCVYCSFGSVPCPPIQEAIASGESNPPSCCG